MLRSRAILTALLITIIGHSSYSSLQAYPHRDHDSEEEQLPEGTDFRAAKSRPAANAAALAGRDAGGRARGTAKGRMAMAALAPAFDPTMIPGPDPVKLAMEDIAGVKAERDGGLWLAGDMREGFSRLQWIAGQKDAELLSVAGDGKVTLSHELLMRRSGADRAGAGARFVIAEYIKVNEGLYLLAQLMAAENRYCLFLGERVPTAGDDIEIDGAINLDNNFDTRINTYRKDGMKLPKECPPEGFDSLVAINPAARWYNLRVRRLVPDGIIVFHELAEALAKVDYGLDYLPDGLRSGAHDIAVQRELKLQSQRPNSDTVTTLGSNVVFKNRESLLKFKAEHETAGHKR